MNEHLRKWFFILNNNKLVEYKGIKEIQSKRKTVSFKTNDKSSNDKKEENTQNPKTKKNNKKVTFNEIVSVVKVESYKQYYKEHCYNMDFDHLSEQEKEDHCFGCLII